MAGVLSGAAALGLGIVGEQRGSQSHERFAMGAGPGEDRPDGRERTTAPTGDGSGSGREVAPPELARRSFPGWPIRWRDSVAIGVPEAGRLERGVRLPPEGDNFFTWDPILKQRPNRPWRRWATDQLLHTVLRVIRAYARDHPAASRLGIGDLSRPHGGSFGAEFGGIGHATHQNGLDADVYYPRLDRAERPPLDASEIDPDLSQDLVDRFLAAGAVRIYVGPNTGLSGPPEVVQVIPLHDNHLHVRVAG